MSFKAQSASLQQVASLQETNIYKLNSPEFLNRFFVLTSPGSRKLLSFPEVIGFPCYTALLEETSAALRYLLSTGLGGAFEILTILRGGLNYPLEEACAQVGIRVRNMHFLSCERVIQDHVITGLEIKYEKVGAARDRVLAIGDILATGDTFRFCLDHFLDLFARISDQAVFLKIIDEREPYV